MLSYLAVVSGLLSTTLMVEQVWSKIHTDRKNRKWTPEFGDQVVDKVTGGIYFVRYPINYTGDIDVTPIKLKTPDENSNVYQRSYNKGELSLLCKNKENK